MTERFRFILRDYNDNRQPRPSRTRTAFSFFQHNSDNYAPDIFLYLLSYNGYESILLRLGVSPGAADLSLSIPLIHTPTYIHPRGRREPSIIPTASLTSLFSSPSPRRRVARRRLEQRPRGRGRIANFHVAYRFFFLLLPRDKLPQSPQANGGERECLAVNRRANL